MDDDKKLIDELCLEIVYLEGVIKIKDRWMLILVFMFVAITIMILTLKG